MAHWTPRTKGTAPSLIARRFHGTAPAHPEGMVRGPFRVSTTPMEQWTTCTHIPRGVYNSVSVLPSTHHETHHRRRCHSRNHLRPHSRTRPNPSKSSPSNLFSHLRELQTPLLDGKEKHRGHLAHPGPGITAQHRERKAHPRSCTRPTRIRIWPTVSAIRDQNGIDAVPLSGGILTLEARMGAQPTSSSNPTGPDGKLHENPPQSHGAIPP